MANMVDHLANIVAGIYLRRVEEAVSSPYKAQQEVWRMLMEKLRTTEYGRRHGAGHVLTYEAFCRNFPVVEYAQLHDYIERMRHGERNVLWPGVVKWFAKSSGTTGHQSKYIPVTDDVLQKCHYRGGYDLLSYYVRNNPGTRFYLGKGLTLGGSHRVEESTGLSKEGDLSAILLQNIPQWADMIRLPSREVALRSEWQHKLEGIAAECIGKNITSITGVPSWNLVMLNYLLEVSGKRTVGEMWPNLEVFFHGGVSFSPYREQFQRTIGLEHMRYMENYNASEGYFALQSDPTRSDMLLMVDYGVFYEFIDMDTYHSNQRSIVPLEGVKEGRNYAMLITSTNGLVRYVLGDTVRFTSVRPYRIEITGRTKFFINAFGEELILDNAERALRSVCKQMSCEVGEYTAGPIFMQGKSKGRHEWMIEFVTPPANLGRFAQLLDEALQKENSDYQAKRAGSITLQALVVYALPSGTFLGWMRQHGKMGGQHKVPRLANDRTHLDSLHRFVESEGISPDYVDWEKGA